MIWLFKYWKLMAWGALSAFALISLASGVSYYKGYRRASEACKTADLERQLAQLKRSEKIARQAQENATQRAIERAEEITELNKKVLDYEDALEARDSCLLSDADAQRLRGIQ